MSVYQPVFSAFYSGEIVIQSNAAINIGDLYFFPAMDRLENVPVSGINFYGSRQSPQSPSGKNTVATLLGVGDPGLSAIMLTLRNSDGVNFIENVPAAMFSYVASLVAFPARNSTRQYLKFLKPQIIDWERSYIQIMQVLTPAGSKSLPFTVYA